MSRYVLTDEAQGDLIVRRDSLGRITYANDAFGALAGRHRDALLGTAFTLQVAEQSDAAVLPDGTRTHDQKITCSGDARWSSCIPRRWTRHAKGSSACSGATVRPSTSASTA